MKKWIVIILKAAICITALYGIMLGIFYLKITEKSDRELWRITDYSVFDLVAVNNLLIFSGHKTDYSVDCNCVYAANKSTGEIVWSTEEIVKPYMNSGAGTSTSFSVDSFVEMVSSQKGIVYISLYYYDVADNPKSALIAVRSNDGKLLWEIDGAVTSDSFANSVLEKNQIFFIDEAGDLLAINSDTGKEMWQHNIYFRSIDACIWFDYYKGTVFMFDSERGQKIEAFDAETGQSIWESDQLGSGRGKVYIFNKTLYVTSSPNTNNLVTAIGLATGKKRWEMTFQNADEFSMVVGNKNEVLFLTKKYDGGWKNFHKLAKLIVVDEITGQPLWKFNESFSHGDLGYLINDGTVYIGTEDGFVYSLDSTTGNIIWQNQTGHFPIHFAVNGNALIVVYKEKYISVLDPRTGLQKWRSDIGIDGSWSVLGKDILRIKGNTILVIGNNDQKIYALDVNTGSELWSWMHFLPTYSPYEIGLLDKDTLYVDQWPRRNSFVPDSLVGEDWYFALKIEP